MANRLYIASANAPLSDRFQEMLDMLMTGAAFGLPTTLWLTDGCLNALAALPANDSLSQLADFGVRCVASETAAPGYLQVEKLSAATLRNLSSDCQQVLVF
ncbi:hypothetical protein [Alcanivorax sp. DP30]|uniref:hypothetical protein n=1 Tax=Alcanivorax sp. DP30 TaxID=2606217 RepID=UPI00136D281F|nr:hypothetical protein [Alcanivorax sp. DP30]MZR61722.1 hypothetical protein [Alcanivorax sp. DP30]